jgi:hypothetical protein
MTTVAMPATDFYARLAANRQDSEELQACIRETIQKFKRLDRTSPSRPGMLLGKVQSGKTRAFLGIIALAFDEGYDIAVVLTKGTKSLTRQTVQRIKTDFAPFIADDQVQVYDIMQLPELTGYELSQKLIFVVKKEDDNMKRLLQAFETRIPSLHSKHLLIVDDEADFASVSFRQKDGMVAPGVIASQIDQLQRAVPESDFLQVTATPYSLYLQPEEEVTRKGHSLFLPKKPSFTQILPIHGGYVGGEDYFEHSADPTSPAYYFYCPVPMPERDALQKPDGRRLQIEEVLTHKNTAVLRDALMAFLVGGVIRRIQQAETGQQPQKFSFLFHTEQQRASHDWQELVVSKIIDGFVHEASADSSVFWGLLEVAYDDLKRSLQLANASIPPLATVAAEVKSALAGGFVMITKVNSNKQVDELLDDDGQLRLRTPFNLFIGGQILDRGVTIRNMIGFYYGRNPQRLQQDTVLQHSRMYGARPVADLPVTRFYAPKSIYDLMKRIHEFDSALRTAFISGAHDKGVYFVRSDDGGRLIPCSPNKLTFSDLTAIRPGKRLLPFGFQTIAKSYGHKTLAKLDELVDSICGHTDGIPQLVPVEKVVEVLRLCYELLDPETYESDDLTAQVAALEHLARIAKSASEKDHVHVLAWRGRTLARERGSGRLNDSPDTKQQTDAAHAVATDAPALILLRNNGAETDGWRDLPFWWPVVVIPRGAVTSIFAGNAPATT